MIMALEQPAIIDRILVVQILNNLQFSTKVLKFGILQVSITCFSIFPSFKKKC